MNLIAVISSLVIAECGLESYCFPAHIFYHERTLSIMPVEPITAALLVAALSTKAFEKVAEKTGETALSLIKGLFTPDELITLDLSAEALQDSKAQGKLEGKLEDRLIANPDIANQLEALLAQLPELAGKQNTLSQSGTGNKAAQDVTNSTVTIS